MPSLLHFISPLFSITLILDLLLFFEKYLLLMGGLVHTLILDLLLFFEKNLFIYFGGSFTYTYSRFFIILENLFMGGLVHTLILLSAILGYLPAESSLSPFFIIFTLEFERFFCFIILFLYAFIIVNQKSVT